MQNWQKDLWAAVAGLDDTKGSQGTAKGRCFAVFYIRGFVNHGTGAVLMSMTRGTDAAIGIPNHCLDAAEVAAAVALFAADVALVAAEVALTAADAVNAATAGYAGCASADCGQSDASRAKSC